MAETEVQVIQHRQEPITLEVKRNAKGDYEWNVKLTGDDDDAVLERWIHADGVLRGHHYPTLAADGTLIPQVSTAEAPAPPGANDGSL
jgi:hypothetical protein